MDLTPGPAEDQERSDEKPLGLLELIPDEAERGQIWRKVWEEYDAAYNEWRDNNPGWKAFYTAHHSYALDAALAVFGEALTSAAYRAGREDAAKADSDVLREEAGRYESSWRAKVGVGAAVPLPQPYASFVGWLRERARGRELEAELKRLRAGHNTERGSE